MPWNRVQQSSSLRTSLCKGRLFLALQDVRVPVPLAAVQLVLSANLIVAGSLLQLDQSVIFTVSKESDIPSYEVRC